MDVHGMQVYVVLYVVSVCVWRHQVFFLTAPYLTYLERQGVSTEHRAYPLG